MNKKLLLIFIVILGLAIPSHGLHAQDSKTKTEKKVEAADADQGDIIKLNPKDESIGFTRTLLRDTSKDPKREPGPINIQRTDFGLAYTGIPTFFKLPVALTPDDLKAGKVDVAIMGASVDMSISRRGAGWSPRMAKENPQAWRLLVIFARKWLMPGLSASFVARGMAPLPS